MGSSRSSGSGASGSRRLLRWVIGSVVVLAVVGGGTLSALAILPSSASPGTAATKPAAGVGVVPSLSATPSAGGSPAPSLARHGPWTGPVPVGTGQAPVSVSCVSAATCYAAAANGTVLVSSRPGAWQTATSLDRGSRLTDISCAGSGPSGGGTAAQLCAATDASGKVVLLSGGTWNDPVAIDNGSRLNSVSCPTASFCMAVDSLGYAYEYTGTAAHWTQLPVDPAPDALVSVSCATADFCVVMARSGTAFTYDHGNWSSLAPPGGFGTPSQVSCAGGGALCAVVFDSGYVATLANGTWSGPTDLSTPGTDTVSCASAPASASTTRAAGTVCVAADAGGDVTYYSRGRWSAPAPSGFDPFTSVSCGSDTACAAVDGKSSAYDYSSAGLSGASPPSSVSGSSASGSANSRAASTAWAMTASASVRSCSACTSSAGRFSVLASRSRSR